ncbi:hypothetical protein [Saccharothrix yanglingensis]|uniref:hypothetical protein n=1 Tax=Saccharothrix yanglingensis TaxID=659496 RepID=UPI0027D2DAB4|nr:hypothetical protein [Saccharothrix yanglingensis]
MTTRVDLLGRVVDHVDANGVRGNRYDESGRVASQKATPPDPADPRRRPPTPTTTPDVSSA